MLKLPLTITTRRSDAKKKIIGFVQKVKPISVKRDQEWIENKTPTTKVQKMRKIQKNREEKTSEKTCNIKGL